ncbi:MAG: membrane protein insertase YidC [Kiritimatiellia bacterium]|jgi:YidC/Oxa1 family membrane protein insertase
MNKTEKLIVFLLFALLVGIMHLQQRQAAARAQAIAKQRAEQAFLQQAQRQAFLETSTPAAGGSETVLTASPDDATAEAEAEPEEERVEEKTLALHSDEIELEISSHGGVLTRATLLQYKKDVAKDSGNVVLEFTDSPALAVTGVPGVGPQSAFELEGDEGGTNAVLRRTTPSGLVFERTITLLPNYEVSVRDVFRNTTSNAMVLPTNTVSLGVMHVERSGSSNRQSRYQAPSLGIDALRSGTSKAEHFDTKLAGFFGARGGGCGGPPDARDLPESVTRDYPGACDWIAIKSRFFVSLFSGDQPNIGYTMQVSRDARDARLSLESVAATVRYEPVQIDAGGEAVRTSSLYLGPKRLSSFWNMGGRRYQVMQFGKLTWICLALVPLLNGLAVIGGGNYGVAIILLTLLIRLLLWPLTHKGTQGAKRMQEIQPKLKELQEKFKDDPQKLQQETLLLYRENRVNPMSSCLPLLLQMPVLIAMYTVLRSAVELRFAPFLWIADLSEAENLFAGKIPFFYSLNILPIVMAATMILQTKLSTASMGGDASQQKMMTWLMPVMMLLMFYPLSSGLVLYWTVSNLLAIGQTWFQQRAAKKSVPASQAVVDVGHPEMTRQMRRRMGR